MHIPSGPDEVDAAWLSAVFGVEVAAVEPGEPTGGIPVTSRVVRLRLDVRPPGAAPERVVVKLANPAWRYSDMYRREVEFYRDFAAGTTLPIPACYHAAFDADTGAFALVLEDVGDARQPLDGLEAAEAAAVADGLADLHRAWWGRPELGRLEVRGHSTERIAETVATFDGRWRTLEALGKYPIDEALRAVVPDAVARYAAGMAAISREPQTLIHSDMHVENFFLRETHDGLRLVLVDWQNPRHGHCAFDLSHLLSSVKPALIAGECDRLLAHYHTRLAAPGYGLERLRADAAAGLRHQFLGSANWFATFEAETLRDATTLRGHWSRLAAALVALGG